MRRENRKKSRLNSNFSIYAIEGMLLLAIATFVIVFIVYSNKLNEDLYALDSEYLSKYIDNLKEEQESIVVQESEIASSSVGRTIEEMENIIEEKKEEIEENRQTVETVKTEITQKELSFIYPVHGEISKEYAKDSLIYSETLKEWTTHLGIDIKSEKANIVMAAEDGVVSAIKNDPRYGLTIIIEHSKGFKTLYANLLTTEFVEEGEEVKQGQTIATVGDSSVYEIVDEPHLHFEMSKDGENVNPLEYIK